MSEESVFSKLSKINVNDNVEKKGQFAYLSWPWAIKQLRLAAPTATWEVIRFDGKPFLDTPNGFFVEVAVTVDGVTLSQIHPVLDSRNKPLLAPNAFDINTSIQRCLVKAIALHGLGLYLYAGEDLPDNEEALRGKAIEIMGENVISRKAELWWKLRDSLETNEEKTKAWHIIDSTTRREIKQHEADLAEAAKQELQAA